METATSEELNKITTMKLSITFFITKLENFINETNATDENLLRLLSHLTDSIQAFVLAAKVIKTNHTIESIVDKHVLTCENIFECLACNVQTGKTYMSVLNHINTTKHIAHAKQFEKQKKNTIAITTRPLQQFPPNREFEMHRSQFPLPNNPFPLLPNQMNNLHQQPVMPPLPPVQILSRPNVGVGMLHGLNSIQGNAVNDFGINNNNTTLVNGFMNNFNQMPSLDAFQNYKELFKMPLPTNVVGFQQNNVSPLSNYRRNLNQTKEESSQVKPSVEKSRRQNRRERRREKSKNSNHQNIDVKFLHPEAVSFIRGNFENEVEEFVNAAKKLSSDELYTEIKTNLIDCCREMNVNAEVKCFGSRITGIGSTNSDIDLNISVAGSNQTADSFLQEFLKILSTNPNWTNATYIKSRVSLIRARHINKKLDCDITFNNELAMTNTKLMKYFYRIQPECQKLVVFIKMLFDKVKLYPQINTYTINLLVFYYLQSDGHLPKVVNLIEKTSSLKYWPNEFNEKTFEELNLKKVKTFNELCIGFVNFYYYQVDFQYYVLSIFTGTKIPKSQFGTPEYRAKNDCYKGLLQYMEDNESAAECIRTNFKMAMCVQDPFSHDHNVSRCVGKLNLKRFRECCHDTYDVLHFQSVRENDSS